MKLLVGGILALDDLKTPHASGKAIVGGAGIYSSVQPALSQRLLKRKMDSITATDTQEVITANPGCMLQVEMGFKSQGKNGRVRHVVDILDEAYGLE